MRLIPVLWISLVCVAGLFTQTRAEDGPVKIFRPASVGDQFSVSAYAVLNEKMLVRIGDTTAQKRDKSQEVEFLAKSKVLEVTPAGRPTQTSYAVERFNSISADKTSVLVDQGQTVISTTKDGKRVFTLKDGELSKDAQVVLSLLFGLSDSKYNEDELFETRKAKGGVSEWQPNPAVLVEEYKNARLKITKDDVSATFKTSAGPKDAPPGSITVTGTILLKNAAPPLPRGMELLKGDSDIVLSWILPSDKTKHIWAEHKVSKMASSIKGKTPDGQDMLMDSEMDQKIEIKYK